MTTDLAIVLMFCIGFLLGAIYGWVNKKRYPGNTSDEWSKGYKAGYKTAGRGEFKRGYNAGKTDIMKRIEKVKLED